MTADPLTSVLVWRGSVPETPTVGVPFTLHARVQASLGVPTGTIDFTDATGTVCHAVPVDTAGDAQCQVPASATTGLRQFVLRFESATDDYTDASLDGVDIVVVDGVRSVRVSIDNAGRTFHPGALLDYIIELRDESGAGDSEVQLQMVPPVGTVGMLWTCISGFGGAACPPDAAPVSGTLNVHAILPAGGTLRYEASMTVAEPTPDRIEATVVATLPATMVNDDPAALIGTDVDYHVAAPMFVDGFESPVPQLHVDSMVKAWQGLANWPDEDATSTARHGSTRTLLQVRLHGRLVGWREAQRRDGAVRTRDIWWDAAAVAWTPGPWRSR